MGVLNYKRFDTELLGPTRENPSNAGYDLFARVDEEAGLLIQPGKIACIPLNVATEIPVDTVGLLFQRSSTRRKWGIKLTNNVGVIDSLFCGDGDEWEAEFENVTDRPALIEYGDKICQALFIQLAPISLQEVDVLGNPDCGDSEPATITQG